MNLPRARRSALWAVPFALLIAACSMSVGTAERAEPPVAPEVDEPITAGATVPKDVEAWPDRQPVPQGAPVVAPPAEPPVVAQPVPVAPPEAFAMNLFEVGDFVPQHTFEWCVAASVQIAWNMVNPDIRSSYSDQQALWERARELSNNPYRGADPGGWGDLLNEIGLGPYELVSVPDYEEALRVAAAALRDTGRPVGLVMWRGRHAWVMSGFESMGDPSLREDFEVTGIRVVDPLYPYGSGTWGPSPEPNQLLTKEELAKQFVFREQRRWSSHIPSGFLLVLPLAAEVVAGRDVTGGPGSRSVHPPFEAQ